MTIFDVITAQELETYYNDVYSLDREPYITEELFDERQKLGLSLKWLITEGGAPKPLKNSAFDVAAIPRKRIGLKAASADMPYFKESLYVDEELRQQLNMVIESGNTAMIQAIVTQIFNDEMPLIESASVTRERMRTMLITTGVIALENNGQVYTYDYQMPESHKVTVTKSWSDPTADILGDIDAGIQKILDDEGVQVTRALCSSKVLGYMKKNNGIKNTLLALTQGNGVLTTAKIKEYLLTEYGLDIVTHDKRYEDENGTLTRFVEDDLFVLLPGGKLGTFWFGTTPEQSDLQTSNVANVAIVDNGVAVTTITITDPVNVETKVTQICLPTCPVIKQIYVLDVIKSA